MQRRDITDADFDHIVSQLTSIEHQPGSIETVTGHHPDYGRTILLRDASRCLVVVDDPQMIDRLRSGGLSAEGDLL